MARDRAEAVASTIAAFIGGWFVEPAICLHLHIAETEMVRLVGLCVGLVFWQAIPPLSRGLLKLTASKLQVGATP